MDKIQLPKMLKNLHLYLLLLCSLIGFEGFAQTFPISVTTQIAQPSPIYLSKYADATTINSPIKIQLLLNDLTISNRQVRLKIYFQGNGVSFSNNDFVVGAKPLYLEGGFPLQLTNVDLAPYFQFQNLLGLNPNQYAQPLPEGISNFYVEVYDFATGKKLSRKTGTTTVIFQNEPPFLNLPLNNASIMQQNLQNIVFNWTPRSINVSNVEYEFSLVEIWDNYTPVQNAFAYSPPLYTTTTKMTTLQYGMSEPQLIPGKKYAWRIKAKAILGAEEIGVFKNNGYTEIFAFTYEVFCTSPLAIKTESIGQDQAKINWSGNIDNFDYQVNYREKNSGSEWYKAVTPRENITLSNLKPNTTYEYTVGSSCDVGKYIHSSIYEFTTIARDEIVFQGCGIKPDPKDLTNQTPLPELFPNDVISAGDFPIVVLHATGSNGTFSGDGYVTLPFLEKFRKLIDAAEALSPKDGEGNSKWNLSENTRIKITFDNIGLNTDFKLISGEIVAGYDAGNWDKFLDVDKLVDEYDPIMESIFGPKPTKEETDTDTKEEEEGENTNPINSTPPSEDPIEYNPITDVVVDEPEPTPPPIKEITPVNNEKEEPSTAPSKGEVTADGYYIEHKGQKYYNNGKIKIPFNRNLLAHNRFKMGQLEKDVNVKYELTYQSGKGILAHKLEDNSYLNTIESKTEADFDFSYTNTLNYKLKSTAQIDKSPNLSNEINLVVKPFNLKNLKAIDLEKKNRFANAGQTLYYVNTGEKENKNTQIEAILSQTDPDKIPKNIITWKINDIYDEHLDGKTTFSIPLSDKSKVKTSTYTNTTGFPTLMSENVTVKWVDENQTSSKFTIGTSSIPFLEEAFKLTKLGEKIGKSLENVPFIKRMHEKERLKSGIGFTFDVIPFSQTLKNVEDPNSRLYFSERTISGGIELGLEGSTRFTIWGIPYDKIPYIPDWVIDKAKKIVKAEVFVIAKAKAGGEMKIEYVQKKLVEQNNWKEVSKKVNPAKIALNLEFGAGAEIKLLEDNDYFSVGGDATGIAKAEILTLNWVNNKFVFKPLQEGIWIDFTAGMYIRVSGVKYETAPLYKKIQIVEPPKQ